MDAGVVSGLLQTRPRGTSVEKKRFRCEGTRGKRPATAGGCGGASRLRRRRSSPMHRGIAFVAAPCIRSRGARNAASHPFQPPDRPSALDGLFAVEWGARREERTELVEVDGLGQMRIETGRESLTLVMRADVSGQGDEEDLLLAEVPPEPLGDLVTVHIGQTDVDQRDARGTVERALDPRQPAVGDVHDVPAGFEELAETFPRVVIVLDDQNPRRRSL